MSSSFIGRISAAGSSRSRLTLDTCTHLARELQILPRLALVARRAQQAGGMIGDDQWDARNAEGMLLLTQPRERRLRLEQVLRGDAPHGKHDFRLQQRDLP